jgi:basic membrane lipoprotein Med (substrate-binding protein (PBP1-ABC) superfamily)
MGEVHNDRRGSYAVLSTEAGIPQGPTALRVVYNDIENGRSNVISHTGASYEAAVDSATKYHVKVEVCDGPVKKRRFLGLLQTIECGISNKVISIE